MPLRSSPKAKETGWLAQGPQFLITVLALGARLGASLMAQTTGRRECEVSQTDTRSVIGRVLKREAAGSREREISSKPVWQTGFGHTQREKARALRAYRWLATACTFATQATAGVSRPHDPCMCTHMLQTVTSAANLLPDLARSQTIGNPAIVSPEQNGRSLVRPLLPSFVARPARPWARLAGCPVPFDPRWRFLAWASVTGCRGARRV